MSGSAGAQVIVLDDFEGSVGRFAQDPDVSGTTAGLTVTAPGVGPSTSTLDTSTAFSGTGSMRIFADDDPAVLAPDATAWRVRFLSGGGTPANNAMLNNTPTSHVGYWLRTTTPNFRAALMLDDGAALERSTRIPVIADGLWHLYQWNLADADQWDGFAGTGPNGVIDAATVTIDSLYFDAVVTSGDQDATFNIDAVSFNPSGPIPVPEPGALGLAVFGAGALWRWRRKA
jgi:MYXO-CTERM domain-containing protein